ncbi:uncharacterized protein LOC128640443 [Bombina bombina]|uniref:uncharacterized protein LOC128640443 n=1 Tax=Bombina bombina TaxID=8345 RepID=UPI00235AB28B|nr:uncharacterized protein LOC128640443 [Bombina bombina]
MACKMEKVDDTIAENVNKWVLNYIKRHGGPYEIPAEYKQSWELMQKFLEKTLFDKKVSENKRKGCILQGLLSCCVKLEENGKVKENEMSQLNATMVVKSESYDKSCNELNDNIVDLRVHAVATSEALIEKAKWCDMLTKENERLKERSLELEREVDECRHATNMAFNRMAESMAPWNRSPSPKIPVSVSNSGIRDAGYKTIYPWEDLKQAIVTTLPAAPTTTTTVLNHDNTGEVQLVTKHLKPQEMDAIVREIGQIPQHDINRFLQWFCNFQRVKEEIRDEILSVTPDPSEMCDILLRADNLWRRKIKNESFAVDAARIFRVEGHERKERSALYSQKPSRLNRSQHIGGYRGQRDLDREKEKSGKILKPWVPFHEIKNERDRLQEELNKVKCELDKIKKAESRVAAVEDSHVTHPKISFDC